MKGPSRGHGLGGEQIEGRRAVYELLAARRRRVREVWVAETARNDELITEILELCARHGVPVRNTSVDALRLEARTEAPQGVLAHAEELPTSPLSSLCETTGTAHPFLLALDGVTDPQNLGSLIRTGECAGITGLILPKHRSAHVSPTVTKASAGAVEHVLISLVPGLPAALAECKKRRVWTVGLDPGGNVDIYGLEVADQPIALVLGSEGSGLSQLTKQRCDVLARIPQAGSILSLNVAAAGAIALFEIARRRCVLS